MKILIVDDSSFARSQIRKVLLKGGWAENALVEAENGLLALKLLESETFDLLLLDWNMPELSGMELVSKLRTMDAFRKLPVIMITSESDKLLILEAFKAGVTDHVGKPVDEKILLDKIRKIFPGS